MSMTVKSPQPNSTFVALACRPQLFHDFRSGTPAFSITESAPTLVRVLLLICGFREVEKSSQVHQQGRRPEALESRTLDKVCIYLDSGSALRVFRAPRA